MANWPLNKNVVQVRLWMQGRPVHGADGRLANHHGSPFDISVTCRFKSLTQHALGQKAS